MMIINTYWLLNGGTSSWATNQLEKDHPPFCNVNAKITPLPVVTTGIEQNFEKFLPQPTSQPILDTLPKKNTHAKISG